MRDFDVDLEQSEILGHESRQCASGHTAPESWATQGAGAPLQKTRFFQVTSRISPYVNGVYCDICLTIANFKARRERLK